MTELGGILMLHNLKKEAEEKPAEDAATPTPAEEKPAEDAAAAEWKPKYTEDGYAFYAMEAMTDCQLSEIKVKKSANRVKGGPAEEKPAEDAATPTPAEEKPAEDAATPTPAEEKEKEKEKERIDLLSFLQNCETKLSQRSLYFGVDRDASVFRESLISFDTKAFINLCRQLKKNEEVEWDKDVAQMFGKVLKAIDIGKNTALIAVNYERALAKYSDSTDYDATPLIAALDAKG